jgi:hypothetical protein
MRATQSSTASGTWRRTEQFGALRYISRHLDSPELGGRMLSCGSDPDFDLANGNRSGSGASAGWDAGKRAGDARELLEAMRRCHERLTDDSISFGEQERCMAELELLRRQSWSLLDRFLRQSCEQRGRGVGADGDKQGCDQQSSGAHAREDFGPAGAAGGSFAGARGAVRQTLPADRVKTLERGAAGWIAC